MTPGPRIGFQVWGQFVGWGELIAAGRRIEELGFDSLWSNDHFEPVASGGDAAEELDGPVFEAWMTLAAWASETSHIALGCLVSGAGYRNPAVLVKMATALDHASRGRLTLGLGAGWHEREHRAFGIPFPPLRERLDRLEEAAAIVRGLLDGDRVSRPGRWYWAAGARNDPAPLQPRLPLLIGGSGPRRTLPIVARYADAWNGEGDPPTFAERSLLLSDLCRSAGRDPGAVRRTVGLPPPLIRASRGEAMDVLSEILGRHGLPPAAARVAAAASPLAGTAADVATRVAEYAAAGADEVIFDWPAPYDDATLVALAGPVRSLLKG